MSVVIESNKQGRIVIPIDIRKELGVEGEGYWLAEVREGALVLRPSMVIPKEDAWAYTAEHRARHEEAMAQVRAGQLVTLGPADIERLIGAARE